jgi:hypothetical protein
MKFFPLTSSAVPPTVAALPSVPFDGQEVYFQTSSMATDGVRWHLIYRLAATGNHKWEYVGGSAIRAWEQTQSSITGTTYADPSVGNAGPSITLPLAGDYDFTFTVQCWNDTATFDARSSLKIGAASAADDECVVVFSSTANMMGTPSRTLRRNVSAANTVCKLHYRSGASGTAQFLRRELLARPVRVG